MVKSVFHSSFRKTFSKIKDKNLKEKIINQLIKIKETPEIGKPMMYTKKGTREVYISPLRLSYIYSKEEDKMIFLGLYHKDEQ